jgi:hypothetical protein
MTSQDVTQRSNSSSGPPVDNIVDEFRITGDNRWQALAVPQAATGQAVPSPGQAPPVGRKIGPGLRPQGFSPESTVAMTMTVLSIRKEQHQVGLVCGDISED